MKPFKEPVLHNIEAETAVIGCILLDASEYDKVSKIISPSDFVDDLNRLIFTAMGTLYPKIDQVTVWDWLEKQVGYNVKQAAYLSHCIFICPMPSHAVWYAGIVKDYSIKRQAINKAGKEVGEILQGKLPSQRKVFSA